MLIPLNPEKEKKTYEISINRTFLRNAAAMIAAIVLFFAFSTPVENTYVQKNNYAQLLPNELFEQIEEQSVAMTPVPVKNDVKTTESQRKLKHQSPIAVKEVKSGETANSSCAIGKSHKLNTNHPYHIIVAGGISLKDAEAMANRLNAKGFAESKSAEYRW